MSDAFPKPGSDPLLEEIRAVKQSVSAQFGHDVIKLCEHLRRQQELSGRRLVRRKPAPDVPGQAGRSE